ncbi:MAG TPA: RDD family protein [Candidatus Dormibacteraeota bacterium]|nr:RDD family protein [Candidatus Dormibacteraeota bacterium]
MECRRCGATLAGNAAYCSACGQATSENPNPAAALETAPAVAAATPARPRIAYAGFWLRAVAYVIDYLLVALVLSVTIAGPLMQHAGISTTDPWAVYSHPTRQLLAVELLMAMVQWLYWALLESSPWQATVGKKLLGLYVVDMNGKRLTFARASGRFFAKIISTLSLGFGYVMAGFTPKKQALHDLIAKSLVLKKTSNRA